MQVNSELTLDPTSTLTSRTFPGMGAPTWPLMDFWALGWNFISWVEGQKEISCIHLSSWVSIPVIQPHSHSTAHWNIPPCWASINLHNNLFLWITITITKSVSPSSENVISSRLTSPAPSLDLSAYCLPCHLSVIHQFYQAYSSLLPSAFSPSLPKIHQSPPSCQSTPSIPCVYLHGDCVFNQHRSQLSVQLKEDLSLASLVQVTQCQRLDVEDLSSFQLHLWWNKGGGWDRERKRRRQRRKLHYVWKLKLIHGCLVHKSS